MRTIALTQGKTIEILSSYAATARSIPAVAATPGWYVVGSFRVPLDTSARLEVVGMVSGAGLTMNARLFDLTAKAVVSGSLTEIAGEALDTFARSGVFVVPGGHLYQVQVEVVGGSGFGVVKSAQLN